ncbi:hypothetical protein UFOVP221_103 [uncultured Caudovirales phage]|uniref:Uncharacterized protein n=1 Tax=uncultured Caudovirales phage TaxID=2100421 RepID=A0A6J7WX05_9CAUD|nr:hypothetical protein UFOVP221_103 [uncultured Caudovirales phage]
MAVRIPEGTGRRPPVSAGGSSTTTTSTTPTISPEEAIANGIAANPSSYGYYSQTSTTINKPDANAPIEYNVGMIREAYFSSLPSFNKEMGLTNRNAPFHATNPQELFRTTSGGHKGMLVVYVDPNGQYSIDGNPPAYDAASVKRYGFQFHYNPETINMAWSGVPNTDVNLEALGKESFNLIGANATQSSVAFDVLLNRKYDFKYYDPTTGKLKAGVPADLYGNRQPTPEEQGLIWNKGTMYDVEALTNTLLGFKLNSALRQKTSDIGYIVSRQVEIHLGRSLRYRGVLDNFTVSHIHFNENMVPLFSKLSMTIRRYPDYATSSTTGSSPSGPTPSTGGGFSGGGGGGGGGGGV